MFDSCFSQIFDSVRRHKRIVILLSIVAVLVSAVSLRYASYVNNVESMIPANENLIRSLSFLRDSNTSNKLVVSLRLESSEHTLQDLLDASDALAAALQPPLVTRVVSGIAGIDMGENLRTIIQDLPLTTDERALKDVEERISPDRVRERLGAIYRQSLLPGAGMSAQLFTSDPLGIAMNALKSLERLSLVLGYEVTLVNGHFVSNDGRHTMLIVDTPVHFTDGFGSRKLIDSIREQLKNLPDYVKADLIGAHLHTVSNENVLQADIRLMLIIASSAFLLLFLIVFRDPKAIIVFLVPPAAILVASGLMQVVFDKLSYFMLGMGSVIAGIAIDYSIHAYVAIRASGGSPDAVKGVARPTSIGAFTTMGSFLAFFCSSVSGYHELAVFAILSTFLCLLFSLLVLPHFLDGHGNGPVAHEMLPVRTFRFSARDGMVVACWAAVILACGLLSARLTLKYDITSFDGSEPPVWQAEQEFHRVWGGRSQPAALVVQAKTLEEALALNESVYPRAADAIGVDHFASLAPLWPSRETRRANAARWEQFWKNGHEAELLHLILKHGQDYHFSQTAFAPFFENLYNGSRSDDDLPRFQLFERMRDYLVQETKDGWQLVSYFPDRDEFVGPLSDLSERVPGTFVVSRKAFSRSLSQSTFGEISYIATLTVIITAVLSYFCLGSAWLTLLAMLPCLTAVAVMAGVMSLAGFPVNAPVLITAMIIIGETNDYGIFMALSTRREMRSSFRVAVSLCAVTTVIGAGVLLFADHPVLFSIGVSMTSGIVSGWLSSLFVVPALGRMAGREAEVCLLS